jgi:hypothetical protein
MNAEAQAKALKKRKDVYAPKKAELRPKPRSKKVDTDATRQSDFVKRQEDNSAKLAAAAKKKPNGSGTAAASTTVTTTPKKTTTTTSVKPKSAPTRTRTLALKTSTPPKPRPASTPSQVSGSKIRAAFTANKGNNEKKALERMKKASRK